MKSSNDPIHDIHHVTRVAGHVQDIATDMGLSERDIEILTIAAWWHDASRALTRKSAIWMVLCDDLISAIMLWIYTIRFGVFGSTAGVATRIIWCKNATVGKIIGKYFLTKRSKLLLDILDDADKLDLINIERLNIVRDMSETSLKFRLLYKWVTTAGVKTTRLHMKTAAAKKYLYTAIKEMLIWIQKQHVYDWHVQKFGQAWVTMMTRGLHAWHKLLISQQTTRL